MACLKELKNRTCGNFLILVIIFIIYGPIWVSLLLVLTAFRSPVLWNNTDSRIFYQTTPASWLQLPLLCRPKLLQFFFNVKVVILLPERYRKKLTVENYEYSKSMFCWLNPTIYWNVLLKVVGGKSLCGCIMSMCYGCLLLTTKWLVIFMIFWSLDNS